MRADLYVPLSEGVATSTSPAATALLTRTDPSTGSRLSGEGYIRLVEQERQEHPELVQSIVHAAVAAALARRESGLRESCLVTVDGRKQVVGGAPMAGGDIARHVWKDVLEPEMAQTLPPQVTLRWAAGIHEELQTVFRDVLQGDPSRVTILADGRYHSLIQDECHAQMSGAQFGHVITSEQGIGDLQTMRERLHVPTEPAEEFVEDLVRAGNVAPSISAREKLLYGPVRVFAKMMRQLPISQSLDAESLSAHLLYGTVDRNGDAATLQQAGAVLRERFHSDISLPSPLAKRRHSGRAHRPK